MHIRIGKVDVRGRYCGSQTPIPDGGTRAPDMVLLRRPTVHALSDPLSLSALLVTPHEQTLDRESLAHPISSNGPLARSIDAKRAAFEPLERPTFKRLPAIS